MYFVDYGNICEHMKGHFCSGSISANYSAVALVPTKSVCSYISKLAEVFSLRPVDKLSGKFSLHSQARFDFSVEQGEHLTCGPRT